jgi:hypothetical protein
MPGGFGGTGKPAKYPAYDPATDGNRFAWILQAVEAHRASPPPPAPVRFTHGSQRGGIGLAVPEGAFQPLHSPVSYWDRF